MSSCCKLCRYKELATEGDYDEDDEQLSGVLSSTSKPELTTLIEKLAAAGRSRAAVLSCKVAQGRNSWIRLNGLPRLESKLAGIGRRGTFGDLSEKFKRISAVGVVAHIF